LDQEPAVWTQIKISPEVSEEQRRGISLVEADMVLEEAQLKLS